MTATELHQFELSLNELLLIQARLPGHFLPLIVGDSPPFSARQQTQLVRSLVARKILSADADLETTNWGALLAPALLRVLLGHISAEAVFQIDSSSTRETSAHCATLSNDVSSVLTVTRPIGTQTDPPRPESGATATATATATLAPLSVLATLLGDLMPASENGDTVATNLQAAESFTPGSFTPESFTPESFTIGLVHARALVAALRSLDREQFAAVSRAVGAGPGSALLCELDEGIRAIFRVKVFTIDAGCVFYGNWYLGSRGWLRVRLGLAPGSASAAGSASAKSLDTASGAAGGISARALTDSGMITIERASDAAMRTEILELVVEGMMSTHAHQRHS